MPTALDNPKANWSDKLAFEIALVMEGSGEPVATILKAHNLTEDQFLKISDDKTFVKKVEIYRADIEKNGLTFKLKAKAQAEVLLNTSFDLIHHPDVPAAVKADLIKSTVKWAGLEPQKDQGMEGNAGNGVSITINLGDTQPPMKVIEHGGSKAD